MDALYRGILCLGSILLFALGAYLAFLDKVGSATTVFASAIICTIFVYLTRFKKFNGFGIQAELWDEKQVEAAELIDKLKPLTTELGKLLITISARMGRLGSAMNRSEMLEITANIERLLKGLDVSSSEIEKAKSEYYQLTISEIASSVINSYSEVLYKTLQDIDKKISEIQRKGAIDPSNTEWNSLINAHKNISSELKESGNLKYKNGI